MSNSSQIICVRFAIEDVLLTLRYITRFGLLQELFLVKEGQSLWRANTVWHNFVKSLKTRQEYLMRGVNESDVLVVLTHTAI